MGKHMPERAEKGGGSYLSLKGTEDKPVKIRVLSEPMRGASCWTKEGKPVRYPSIAELASNRPAEGWRVEKGKEEKPKTFCAYFVWNHGEKCVQVAEFSQATILGSFDQLEANTEDWGDITGYDVTISRKMQDNGFYEYTVLPVSQKPLPKEAQAEWQRVQDECIGLAALFNGGNPLALFGEEKIPF